MIIGIDPGLKGGISILSSEGEIKHYEPMPVLNKEMNCKALSQLFRSQSISLVVIEKVGMRPHQSAQSGLTAGKNYGMILGILSALKIPFKEVRPQEWTKGLPAVKGTKTPKAIKERNILYAQKLYPGENFLATDRSRVPHDGIVDSVLIARTGL